MTRPFWLFSTSSDFILCNKYIFYDMLRQNYFNLGVLHTIQKIVFIEV